MELHLFIIKNSCEQFRNDGKYYWYKVVFCSIPEREKETKEIYPMATLSCNQYGSISYILFKTNSGLILGEHIYSSLRSNPYSDETNHLVYI